MARRVKARSFGQLAIEAGLLTETQLDECRAVAEEARRKGTERPVEDVVRDKGYMTEEQVRLMTRAAERLQRDEEKAEPTRIGEYEILGKLGDGGLGVVYKARQLSMGRVVALKVLHKKWEKDEEFKKRFLLEARLVGRLSHQNLIQVFYVGRDKDTGMLYYSMEFIDGQTVEDIIDRDGTLTVERTIDIVAQILRALSYIKEHQIVHRDIKPGNIMLTKRGTAKLGDFGFVKSALDYYLSTDGEVLGTPDYISPEQAMGLEEIDWRSDIYSLGASLYHMLTAATPFSGSGSTVMRKHIRAELSSPKAYNPDIPDSICHVIERMMAKDPDDRYKTHRELFDDLDMIRMGENPLTKRLDAGKSTIIRAFKIEQSKLGRMSKEARGLSREVTKLRTYLGFCIGAVVILIIALIVSLVLK